MFFYNITNQVNILTTIAKYVPLLNFAPSRFLLAVLEFYGLIL